MIPQFETLSKEEKDLMTDALSLITILIAGADGNIEPKEKEWAAKIAKIRTYSNPDELHDYYVMVGGNFAKRNEELIAALPKEVGNRNLNISDQLSLLNAIFPKLDPHYAALLYDSFVSFAEHVAKAAGGFLGIGSVNAAEAKWVNLPMLVEVVAPIQEEEE